METRYSPLSLTRNPFDPSFVEPNDLLTLPIAVGRNGLDHLRSKVEEYEEMVNRLGAEEIKRHSVCVMGPSQGGRSTFIKLLRPKLDARLTTLGFTPTALYRYATHPQTQINQEKGPNAVLQDILQDLLLDMYKPSNPFTMILPSIQKAYEAVSNAKELAEISNAFKNNLSLSLSTLADPFVLTFENLSSSGLYGYLQSTFLRIPSVNFVSTYLAGSVGEEFRKAHTNDTCAWSTSLAPADCEEILALTKHNLNRVRDPSQTGLFPFEQAAIEGFYSMGIARQPMGRLMNACFRSIENKIRFLSNNPKADATIRHKEMQEAIDGR